MCHLNQGKYAMKQLFSLPVYLPMRLTLNACWHSTAGVGVSKIGTIMFVMSPLMKTVVKYAPIPGLE
jgi:hypothetical protein